MKDTNIIDFVVTWVDASDPVWREKKNRYTDKLHSEDASDARYRDWDAMKYWFRGVEKFAPWVRYIYFISDDQKPDWLNSSHPKLKWIRHTDYIPEEYLPTFNSHTIEWNFWRIEGLSNYFVYFNDDMFLIRDVCPDDFFVEGKPCGCPGVETVSPSEMFSYIMFNNAFLLNRHFSLRDCLKTEWRKWLKVQNFKGYLRLIMYGRHKTSPGFNSQHIHVPYRKDTFLTLWECEQEWIHDTCMHKKRTKDDISPWCVSDWQFLSGDFYPKKPIGKAFATASIKRSGALEYIRKQKGKVICLNDTEAEVDFLEHKQMILDAFEEILPEKSSFEK